jgi:hypothetical protein
VTGNSSLDVTKMPPWFRALFALVEKAGIVLVLHAQHSSGNRTAFYIAAPTRGPGDVIELWTQSSVNEIDDIEDTINLAHELGHHRVRIAGREPACYRDLILAQDQGTKPPTSWPDEPLETRKAVVEIEQAAWDEGLAILQELRFTGLESYRKRAKESVNTYRKGLSLP